MTFFGKSGKGKSGQVVGLELARKRTGQLGTESPPACPRNQDRGSDRRGATRRGASLTNAGAMLAAPPEAPYGARWELCIRLEGAVRWGRGGRVIG